MLSSEKKARLIQEEINRIADSSESNNVPITRAKLGRGGTKTADGYARLINWLDLKYPTGETTDKKMPAKKDPAGLGLSDDELRSKRQEHTQKWNSLSTEKQLMQACKDVKIACGRKTTDLLRARLMRWLDWEYPDPSAKPALPKPKKRPCSNLKYPSGEAAKKVPYKKAPAKKKAAEKRKAVELAEPADKPATTSEAPKKKHAVPEPEAKLEAVVASVTDGKVGANELQEAGEDLVAHKM